MCILYWHPPNAGAERVRSPSRKRLISRSTVRAVIVIHPWYVSRGRIGPRIVCVSLSLSAGVVFALMCFAGVTTFETVPLGDCHWRDVLRTPALVISMAMADLDIVLVKGRHWQLTSKVLLGDGKGHFAPGSPLPSNATKSYSGSLAEHDEERTFGYRSEQ